MRVEANISSGAALRYRQYQPTDIDQLLSLWTEHTEFGELTAETFRQWYLENPYSPCEIVVAVDEGNRVIGQMVFVPTQMFIDNREVSAVRIATPILHKGFRFASADLLQHPLWNLYSIGIRIAKEKKVAVAYILPAPGWMRAMKAVSEASGTYWQTAHYETVSVSLEVPETYNYLLSESLYFSSGAGFTDEYDRLWDEAVMNMPIACGISRRKEWLQYRFSDCFIVEARENQSKRLVGYAAVKIQDGLLVDLLAQTADIFQYVFWGMVRAFHLYNPNRLHLPFKGINALYSPLVKQALSNYLYQFVDYKFDFGCTTLSDTVPAEAIHPSQWYMLPHV